MPLPEQSSYDVRPDALQNRGNRTLASDLLPAGNGCGCSLPGRQRLLARTLSQYGKTRLFGTGLLNDHQEVKVLDMGDLDGSDNVRIVMKFTAGVAYANVEDIVTYGIVNAAN